MISLSSLIYFLIYAGLIILVVLGPAVVLGSSKLGFVNYIALPLGSIIPWFLVLLIMAIVGPFLSIKKQQGLGFAVFFPILGGILLLVAVTYIGAFYFLGEPSFSTRLYTGMKISSLFAGLVLVFFIYLAIFG